ncbi:MAG: 4-aminobutyrate--2-oxoglutarate transaminase [Hyphomonas sp.]|uniref:4-aminobutyrate--2-oxoglutarate transaminase n=1 Tax=Hyphomonas sp. TaxID=87 RepID=UPI0017FD0D30|nr:4-aminobutyrate--2-oxoglutarate transaminase [Hyphomonas sp.]MBA3069268.1 4-aminobutyrate--2-oxoglutarate transaminase [Hyphomonas sp.]MBU3922596.1 4-aminobutyrate--2-oxoglutarate transaminase [Alphaproteobacteria bacterium]MBU4061784.1 4-aminobutyrate--2-oxoglutarate transaminase [Alphaproteobacteria bacterium]MBU4163384.1 4-aminobutyrate--2-oxoglutarate transaminase [Alphaproteobacteria bacterium]
MDNKALWARREAAVPRGIGSMHPVFAARALNAEIWDGEGRRYIDFAAGIAVTNTGHNHPRVKAAISAQLENFSHVCFQVTPYDSYIELAERLSALAPGPTPKKTIFLTTGAEAVENAVKIARAATGRPGVIAFSGGFHGRTLMTMALTGKVAPYKIGFGPFPGDVWHIPFPAPYLGISEADSLKALDNLFKSDVEAARVAAILIEPVQGEGGFYAATPSFLQTLREICDTHGILLIVDEIQSGFARTGKLFATEYAGIEPDLMTVAKAMAGGVPISGVIGKAAIMDAPATGGLGGTYGGSPLGCAAGLAVLDVIADEKLCERAIEIGERIVRKCEALRQSDPGIGEIRTLGAMTAMELIVDGDAARADPERTKRIVALARESGLLLLSCGVRSNVIRFLSPLTIPFEVLDEGLDILDGVIRRTAA